MNVKDKIAIVTGASGGKGPPQPADSAEYIAEKIISGIEKSEAEIYAHEWMKRQEK